MRFQSVDFGIIVSEDERETNNFGCWHGHIPGGADGDDR